MSDEQASKSTDLYAHTLRAIGDLHAIFPDELMLHDLFLIAHGNGTRFHGMDAESKASLAILYNLLRRENDALVPYDNATRDILQDVLVEDDNKHLCIRPRGIGLAPQT